MLRELLSLRPVPLKPVPKPRALRLPLYVGVFFAGLLTLILYADSLGLPFFQDDTIHVRWLSWHTLFDPWLTAEEMPAYRPLGKFIIKLWWLILGYHDEAWLRFHNIGLHVVNAALTGALAVRLSSRRQRYLAGGLAAVLFAASPWAFQAVPWINVFFYPLLMALLQLMVLLYWEGRARQRPALIVLALVSGALAPFEIEFGLMACGLLGLFEVLWWFQGRQRWPWVWGPVLMLGLNLTALAIWAAQPRFEYSFGPRSAQGIWQMAAIFLQAMITPIAPLLEWVIEPGSSEFNLTGLTSIIILIVLALWLVWRKRGWGALASLGWFGLMILPALASLNPGYVWNSPRLMYTIAPAASWLWALTLTAFIEGVPRDDAPPRKQGAAWRTGLVMILVGVSVVQTGAYVRVRARLYDMAAEASRGAASAAMENPPESRPLFINLPGWLSPVERLYPLGDIGIQWFPDYSSINDVIFSQIDSEHESQAIRFDPAMSEQPYYWGVYGPESLDWGSIRWALYEGEPVYLTQFSADRIRLQYAGIAQQLPCDPGQAAAVFADTIVLECVGVSYDDAENELILNLGWNLLDAASDDVTVFVHLIGAGGLAAQADGYPMLGLGPFWLWEPGQMFTDVRYLKPGDPSPAEYQVFVGIYNRANGERLTALDSSGQQYTDNSVMVWQGILPLESGAQP